ncbi:hypothetical protein GCM10009530_41620 [Microbispora corallina]|uniref:Signal transduction histidine kinase subgroup 3 dimerisation and phosphoacceptor domain-containing protein n=2 Tax=Microbispora corallina TaxID=83302 RepID=A0ABQ4G1G5_9ACTN|nr:hypothetical protein Mco01_39090 [Microbispora corallina]
MAGMAAFSPQRNGACRPRGWRALVEGPLPALALAALLLVAPLASAGEAGPAWAVWAAAAVAGGSFVTALTSARRPWAVRRRIPQALVLLLAAVTVAATAAFPAGDWFTLYSLLAVAVAAVMPLRAAPVLIAVTALAGGVTQAAVSGSWSDALWGTGVTSMLAGMTTYGFRRMAEVIADLARTREQLAASAVSAERLRFARDLHDLLGHTLSMVVVKAEAVRRLAPRDTAAAVRHASDIEAIGRQALTEVREAVTGYRDASLAFELDTARAALATAGIECVVEESGPALSPETDMLLSWVVREGVTNVVRHSGARRCRITVRRDVDPVLAEIRDDGAGGDPAAASGSGLRGLRERLAAAGGRLRATSLPGGFVLAAEVPHAGVEGGP